MKGHNRKHIKTHSRDRDATYWHSAHLGNWGWGIEFKQRVAR